MLVEPDDFGNNADPLDPRTSSCSASSDVGGLRFLEISVAGTNADICCCCWLFCALSGDGDGACSCLWF